MATEQTDLDCLTGLKELPSVFKGRDELSMKTFKQIGCWGHLGKKPIRTKAQEQDRDLSVYSWKTSFTIAQIWDIEGGTDGMSPQYWPGRIKLTWPFTTSLH